jgi:hypothetical protein
VEGVALAARQLQRRAVAPRRTGEALVADWMRGLGLGWGGLCEGLV